MKSDMKKNLSLLVALGLVLVLGACVKDDPTGPGGPGRFRVSIQNPEVVETRSAASSGELTIDDAYVLEFNADGTYKGGDKVEQADILDNGTRSPSLLMKHGFTEGSRIVCLFNTGLGALPAGLQPGVTTTAELNTLFPATSWNINRPGADGNRGIPMSGEMNYSFGVACPVKRSVAKITVEFKGDAGGLDPEELSWGLYHVLRSDKGAVYVPDGETGIVTAPDIAAADFVNTAFTRKTLGSSATEGEKAYYLPEYTTATKAGVKPVGGSDFDTGRTCVVLYSPSRGYFRIDLRDSNRQYIDVRRNTRIRVNIKNIFGYGYLSAEESLLLPGSNIQFSIKIDGDEDVIINNGQYVLLLSHDRKVVPDAPGTYVVATGRYSPSPELPPTPPDGLTNTITLSDIKPANAAPKLTLETHSLSDVAQPINITSTIPAKTAWSASVNVRVGSTVQTIYVGNRARLDFHLNYGDGTPPPPIIAESNAKIVIPEMPNTMYRTGSVFLCWNWNPAPNPESTNEDVAVLSTISMPEQGGILYARWGDEATAKFDTGSGGSAVPDQVKTAKEKWLKPSPDPTREGYIFDGWSDGTNGQKFGGAVTASTTFTAKWKELYKRITIQGTGDQAMLVLTDDPHDAGLYFKWGSVVGLYNAGGANSRLPGAVTDNFSLDDIAFNPTNSKYITITDWNSVPYSTGTALQHNYGTVTMDGLGDPCKLVGTTVYDIKYGSGSTVDNKKWRMPTQADNIAFLSTQCYWGTKDGVNGIYGSWANFTGYVSGSFMPSSGWRASEDGSRYYATQKPVYWSSTAGTNTNTGSAWEYTTTGPSINLKANYDRGYAFPIRCVRQ